MKSRAMTYRVFLQIFLLLTLRLTALTTSAASAATPGVSADETLTFSLAVDDGKEESDADIMSTPTPTPDATAASTFIEPPIDESLAAQAYLPFGSKSSHTGTDYIISDTVGTVDGYGNYPHVQPGDRLLIPSSRTTPIAFRNLKGEEGNQIVIINDEGKVRINANGNWVGVQLRNCEHVRLTGTGDSSVEYGFEIYNSSNAGISAYDKTRYVEIDHIEVHDVSGAGMYAKTPEDIRDRWIQYGTYIHHNYVHSVGTEGFYVGSSFWAHGKEPELKGVEISHNRIERCGWDGIQVGSAVADVKVHHNFVKDIGLEKPYGGGNGKAGLVINTGTTGDFYNNIVINTGRWGFVIQGIGNYRVYNNIIVDAGQLDRDDAGMRWLSGNNGFFYNNTIINSKGDGIKVSSGRTGAIYDNIVAGSSGINIVNNDVAKYNNIESDTIDTIGFVDSANNDFHLLPTSQAVNVGSDTGFAPFDYDDVPRPQGSRSDIGAFEYVGSLPTSTPINTPAPTNTPEPTATSTPLPTHTPTFVSTDMPTPTPSSTPTSAPTHTPLPTNTPTLTPTSTLTPTPTNTPLPTYTPTPTSTPLPANTPTPTPTSTPTPTPTNTPPPTYTPRPTPTSVPSPTNTPTSLPTSTPTLTLTPTPMPTSTSSPTSRPTPTPDVTLTATFVELSIDEPLFADATIVKGKGIPGVLVVVRDLDDLRIVAAGSVNSEGRYEIDLTSVWGIYQLSGLETGHRIQAESEGQVYQAIVQPQTKVQAQVFLPFISKNSPSNPGDRPNEPPRRP